MHELGEFVSHYSEIKSLNAVVVAVSVDPLDKARLTVKELGTPFPVLSDVHHTALNLYGTGLKISAGSHAGIFDKACLVLIDRHGIIRWIHVSENYKIRPPVSEDIAEIRKVENR